MLQRDVFEHRFDHQVHVSEAGVLHRAAGQSHHVFVLLSRDLSPLAALLEHRAHRREPLPDSRDVGVLEPHERSLLHSDTRDARAHESRANHRDFVDGSWLGRRLRHAHVLL